MIKNGRSHPVRFILAFYLLCFILRGIEYFFIRTDQSIIGEAFIHKLAGIALLAGALWVLRYRWSDIGFRRDRALRGTLYGLALGVGVFAVAYGTELLILAMSGDAPTLHFYVTSYAIQGNRGMEDGLLFIAICIAGNIINVIMEEGVFRGLFPRLMEDTYSFAKACLLASALFGLWHIAQPVRNVLDGVQSAMGGLLSGILLVTTSTLLAVQYCMLYKITGSIWAGMAAHFVNNTSVNLLHVVSAGGADQLQTARIAIAQSLSFVVVLVLFLLHMRREKQGKDRLRKTDTVISTR